MADREAIRAYYLDGYSVKDTAKHFSLSPKTISKYISDIVRPVGQPSPRSWRIAAGQRIKDMEKMLLQGASDEDVAAHFDTTVKRVQYVRQDARRAEMARIGPVEWNAPAFKNGEPVPQDAQYRIHEFRFFAGFGYTHVDTAERLGISVEAMETTLKRYGDETDAKIMQWSTITEDARMHYYHRTYQQKTWGRSAG